MQDVLTKLSNFSGIHGLKHVKNVRSAWLLISGRSQVTLKLHDSVKKKKLCHRIVNLPSASNFSEPAVKSVKISLREMDPRTATTMVSLSWSAITQNGNWRKKTDLRKNKNRWINANKTRLVYLCYVWHANPILITGSIPHSDRKWESVRRI